MSQQTPHLQALCEEFEEYSSDWPEGQKARFQKLVKQAENLLVEVENIEARLGAMLWDSVTLRDNTKLTESWQLINFQRTPLTDKEPQVRALRVKLADLIRYEEGEHPMQAFPYLPSDDIYFLQGVMSPKDLAKFVVE